MEPYLLQTFLVFLIGFVAGIAAMLLVNKLKSGTMSPSNVKQEYQDYQEKVEQHFEETSKKFKDMTEQYQDLYQHLSVGATSLCRTDSVAAALADNRDANLELEQKTKEATDPVPEVEKTAEVKESASDTANDPEPNTSVENKKTDTVETENEVKPAEADKKVQS